MNTLKRELNAPVLFLSYSSADREIAMAVVAKAAEHEVRLWYDRASLQVGDDWQARIDTALVEAGIALVVWSRHALRSPHVRHEIELAIEHGVELRIMLCDIVGVPVAWAAAATVYDLREDPFDPASLVRVLTGTGVESSMDRRRSPRTLPIYVHDYLTWNGVARHLRRTPAIALMVCILVVEGRGTSARWLAGAWLWLGIVRGVAELLVRGRRCSRFNLLLRLGPTAQIVIVALGLLACIPTVSSDPAVMRWTLGVPLAVLTLDYTATTILTNVGVGTRRSGTGRRRLTATPWTLRCIFVVGARLWGGNDATKGTSREQTLGWLPGHVGGRSTRSPRAAAANTRSASGGQHAQSARLSHQILMYAAVADLGIAVDLAAHVGSDVVVTRQPRRDVDTELPFVALISRHSELAPDDLAGLSRPDVVLSTIGTVGIPEGLQHRHCVSADGLQPSQIAAQLTRRVIDPAFDVRDSWLRRPQPLVESLLSWSLIAVLVPVLATDVVPAAPYVFWVVGWLVAVGAFAERRCGVRVLVWASVTGSLPVAATLVVNPWAVVYSASVAGLVVALGVLSLAMYWTLRQARFVDCLADVLRRDGTVELGDLAVPSAMQPQLQRCVAWGKVAPQHYRWLLAPVAGALASAYVGVLLRRDHIVRSFPGDAAPLWEGFKSWAMTVGLFVTIYLLWRLAAAIRSAVGRRRLD